MSQIFVPTGAARPCWREMQVPEHSIDPTAASAAGSRSSTGRRQDCGDQDCGDEAARNTLRQTLLPSILLLLPGQCPRWLSWHGWWCWQLYFYPCDESSAGGLVQRDDGLWSIGWTAVPADPSQGLKKGKESGWKARLPGPVAAFATTSQPYWTILPPWGPGLTIPRKQFERVIGARPFLPPGSTSSTNSMAQAGSAPLFRPDPPSHHQDSPVRREPGGAWPATPRRGMWPPLPPGFAGRRLSRSALVR
jgi:hypothetical protein